MHIIMGGKEGACDRKMGGKVCMMRWEGMQDKGGRVCMMNLAPTPSPSLLSLSSQGALVLHVSHYMAIYFLWKTNSFAR